MPLPPFELCPIPTDDYPLGDDRLPECQPAHRVRLAAFSLARTTVTNAQFLAFIAAEGYQTAGWWGEMGWRWQKTRQETHPPFLRDPLFNAPDQPVVGVCWYEAAAYARWLAAAAGQPWRLPSEAEWEAAARGADDTPPEGRANTAAERLGRPWPVTTAGNRAGCGALDLLGNVWEWTSSQWGHNWQTLDYSYPYRADDGREDLSGSAARVMRGGSWFDAPGQARAAVRGRYLPGSRGSNIGFRLALG